MKNELTDTMAVATLGDPGDETLLAVEYRGVDFEGRQRYRWEAWDHGRLVGSGEDLASGAGGVGGKPAEMLGALAGFLSAAAESYGYALRNRLTSDAVEHGDLFPLQVSEWAYQNEDELAMLAMDEEDL